MSPVYSRTPPRDPPFLDRTTGTTGTPVESGRIDISTDHRRRLAASEDPEDRYAVADALPGGAEDLAGNLSVGLANGVPTGEIGAGLRSLQEGAYVPASDYVTQSLPKFAECLPLDLASSTVAIRYTDSESVKACLDERIRIVAARD